MMECSKRMKRNFDKRFKNRISIVYADKPLRAADRQMRNKKICEAYKDVLSGILGREPTPSEILGIKDISKEKHRR